MTDIGFIGLGNMGAALVRRLLPDHSLHVWDLNPAAVEALVDQANINGGHDNITAVLIRVEDSKP